MVRHLLFCFLCCLNLIPASAQIPLGDNEGRRLPGDYKVHLIKAVRILDNGAWKETLSSSSETATDCSTFRLRERDVRDFFRSAQPVDWYTWDYMPYTRCYAAGEVVFTNGDRGRWFIDRGRRASVVLSDGRLGYFYGAKACAKVFDPPLDLQEDSAGVKPAIRAEP